MGEETLPKNVSKKRSATKSFKDRDEESTKIITERSVNNLLTLYTVVIALALVKAIEIIFTTEPVDIKNDYLPTFLSFIFIIIPFYHGASRYLDETYIVKSGETKPLLGLIDFLFFFTEAIFFFIAALLISQPKSFYFWITALLLLDVIWLSFVYFSAKESFKKIKCWFYLNIITALILFTFNYCFKGDIKIWVLLMIIVLIRTVLDYYLTSKFYWPQPNNNIKKRDRPQRGGIKSIFRFLIV